MSGHLAQRAKLLGDLRAEADRPMLDRAFYETVDFKTLVESSDRPVVVGRRGTGKSALLYRLARHLSETETKVIALAPEEDQVIALRPLLAQFGLEFRRVRAGSRIAWRYALIMELLGPLIPHYKFQQNATAAILTKHYESWRKGGPDCTARLRATLRAKMSGATAEERIGQISQDLGLEDVQNALHDVFDRTGYNVCLLVDRLDEGYEPDDPGVGLVAGIVQAAIDLKTRFPGHIRPVLFLRDNIFRTVAQRDPDYSRNVEGHVLRLHWDEQQLFNMACNRLRVAFAIDVESNRKVWDRCTAPDLHGFEGFRQCLRLTLYRPRDVLALLNEAYYAAAKDNATQITRQHVESTAKEISVNRLDDLRKEYSAIIPSLAAFTAVFANGSSEMTFEEVTAKLTGVLASDTYDAKTQQDIVIQGDAEGVARTLYGVGFLGVHDPTSQVFMFCHDGTVSAAVEFKSDTRMLVHPCYWMALNLGAPNVDAEGAQQINDEYEIQVASAAPEVRRARIGELISKLGVIATGTEGQAQFEVWALKAIQIAFGGHLRNIELHPNGAAVQRRDVVGTNLGESPNWKRVREDYETRQVVFELKNYEELTRTDYRQVLSYLTPEYGRLAFVVTRDEKIEPKKGVELDWVRELYQGHKVLVVKLTAKWLSRLLARMRSPEKHDEADIRLGAVLDDYQRMYVGGQAKPNRRGKSRRHPR